MLEKPLEHFEVHSFCKVSFLKIFIKNIDFQAPETVLTQFTAQLRKSKDERSGAKHSEKATAHFEGRSFCKVSF